jgi:hypothetical protein
VPNSPISGLKLGIRGTQKRVPLWCTGCSAGGSRFGEALGKTPHIPGASPITSPSRFVTLSIARFNRIGQRIPIGRLPEQPPQR